MRRPPSGTSAAAVPALAALAAVLLVAGCSAGAPAASGSPAPAASGREVQRLTLTVRGGSVTGDTGTVDVGLGRPVELTVTSDVADEVHVHGVDVGRDVAAGSTVVIDFVQPAPGRFEVELEHRRQVLTRLQVS